MEQFRASLRELNKTQWFRDSAGSGHVPVKAIESVRLLTVLGVGSNVS